MRTLVLCLLILAAGIAAVHAETTLWSEDFADVTDWLVIDDPGKGSSIITDGSTASLYVNSGASEAAFGPNTAVAPFLEFDPTQKAGFDMTFTVSGLTDSTSYDIRLDEFDVSGAYIGTVYSVAAQGTFVGTKTVNLGAFEFQEKTARLLPKVTVFTGEPKQTVRFKNITFTRAVAP